MNKTLFLTDALIYPYDEGFRKFAYYLYEYFTELKNSEIFIINENHHILEDANVKKIKLNKLFLNINFLCELRNFTDIIYYPLSSITFNSIIRSYLMSLFAGNIHIIGLQQRKYNKIEKFIVSKIKKINYILQSNNSISFETKNTIIESGIDIGKFYIINNPEKIIRIKEQYSIPLNKKIFLHVGHIKSGRNIDELISIQKDLKEAQIIVVGSTSTECDDLLKKNCIDNNIIIIDSYVNNIAEIYNISDCYLFLVKDPENFIDKPLSVLEALACGRPVVSYKKTLKDKFKSIESALYLFDTYEEIFTFLNKNMYIDYANISELVSNTVREKYSWDKIIKKSINEVINNRND